VHVLASDGSLVWSAELGDTAVGVATDLGGDVFSASAVTTNDWLGLSRISGS
jgi:hypothetical protein